MGAIASSGSSSSLQSGDPPEDFINGFPVSSPGKRAPGRYPEFWRKWLSVDRRQRRSGLLRLREVGKSERWFVRFR